MNLQYLHGKYNSGKHADSPIEALSSAKLDSFTDSIIDIVVTQLPKQPINSLTNT